MTAICTSVHVCHIIHLIHYLRCFIELNFTVQQLSLNVLRVLVHGQVTIIFVVSVGLSVCFLVCLFVCLFVCAEFFSAVFDPISIKLGHMLYVWV